MTRIVGPPKSRRRHWTYLLCLVAALGVGMVFISGAQAVHDTGLFQLDGDAQQSTVPTGFVGGSDDWDSICNVHLGSGASTPGPLCYKTPGVTLDATSSADKSTFITDAFNAASDNIYKGGTDDADVNTWLWKQATPSPNKADLENAFAAQYTGTAAPYVGHQILFFGGDRFANNGDTNIGLWFFHNKVTAGGANTGTDTNGNPTCSLNSGCGFTNVHQVGNISLGGSTGAGCNPNPDPTNNVCTPGDIFILSAFTGGGTEPTIKVFEWVGPGKATKDYLGSNGCFTNTCTLQPLSIPNTPGFADNRCDGPTVTGDVACAIVNPGEIISPWLFQDSSSKSPANMIEANELYEGGLDLTGLGFGEACFSSVLLNTRSSQSGTSVLQDFALGGFGNCGSSTTTTPSGGGEIPASGGLSVTDSATLTVSGISTWSGTYAFHLCFIGTDTTSTATCTSGGTAVAGSWTGAPTVNQGTTQPLTSLSATVTSAGRYCWRGDFTSSTTGVPDAVDSTGGECFNVTPKTPTLTTNATNQTLGNAQSFGGSIDDTATLSGTANKPGSPVINPTTAGGAATGTITITAYGPFAVDHTPVAADCTGTAVYTSHVTVLGNGDYTASSGDGGAFTPTQPGLYLWLAKYGGDPPNTSAASDSVCPSSVEQSFVQQIPTDVKTKQSWFPNDTATVSAATGNLGTSGTVDFFLYNNATCLAGTNNANLKYSERQAISGGVASQEVQTHNFTGSTALNPSGGTVTPFSINTLYTDSTSTSTGSFSWKVVYTPNSSDTAHTGSSSSCTTGHTETFAIQYTNDPGH